MMADVLAADKQLANEIEFDMRKFEEQEKQQQKDKQQKSHSDAVSHCTMLVRDCVGHLIIHNY